MFWVAAEVKGHLMTSGTVDCWMHVSVTLLDCTVVVDVLRSFSLSVFWCIWFHEHHSAFLHVIKNPSHLIFVSERFFLYMRPTCVQNSFQRQWGFMKQKLNTLVTQSLKSDERFLFIHHTVGVTGFDWWRVFCAGETVLWKMPWCLWELHEEWRISCCENWAKVTEKNFKILIRCSATCLALVIDGSWCDVMCGWQPDSVGKWKWCEA